MNFWKSSAQAAKLPMTSCFLKQVNFLPKVLPQAAKLSGTSGFLRKSSAPGSEARDKWLLQKNCPRQRSCPRQVASYKKIDFLEKVLPQAAKLPGTSCFFKKKTISAKSSAPGNEAAQDKWPLKTNMEKFCPGSEAARDKWLP